MASRRSRALGVFFLFLLFAAPIGAIAFGVLATIAASLSNYDLGLLPITMALAFIVISYAIGGLQAAFVGAVTAAAEWRNGRASIWLTLTATGIAALVTLSRIHEGWDLTAILIVVHLITATACWLIARRALM